MDTNHTNIRATNKYTNMSPYYDLILTNGYYDYQGQAESLHSIIGGGRKQIVELGVGSGLLAEKILAIDSHYEYTGVDFSHSMLEIARKRLENRAKLTEADVTSMNLADTFDIAISNGGVWFFVDSGNELHLYSHVTSFEQNLLGLKNVAKHLRKDGLFILNVQGVHKNYEVNLPNNIVYSQEAKELKGDSGEDYMEKKYFFHKEGELLAQEKCFWEIFHGSVLEEIMDKAGFKQERIHENKMYVIYSLK